MVIQKDISLSQILWYKLGGKTKYLIGVDDEADILRAVDFIDKKNIKNFIVCGLGSNLVFPDDYFDGAIIHIAKKKSQNEDFIKKGNYITVYSGVLLNDLIQYSFENNLTGLEWAGGLPGTVGGAVRGNVGAFGGEIKDIVSSADAINQGRDTSIFELSSKDLNFSYRNSCVKENKNLIITTATFKLKPSSNKEIIKAKEVYENNIKYRQDHHPLEYPTCGSVFKNITKQEEIAKILKKWPDIEESVRVRWHDKVPVAYILGRLNMAGKKVGDMQISTKHANFIVNTGGGRSSDLLKIISSIKNKFNETFNFIPEVEVEIVKYK